MSWMIAGSCWDMDLRPHQMLVLVAMADHADHDGRNVFPGVRMIAWKTGLTKRSVYRIQKELRDLKVLVRGESDAGASGKAVYEIDLDAVPLKSGYPGRRRRQRVRGGGDTMSPPSPDSVSGPPLTPEVQGGDTGVTPVRTVTVHEPPPPPVGEYPRAADRALTEVVVQFLTNRENGSNGQPADPGLLSRFRWRVASVRHSEGPRAIGLALAEFEGELRSRPNSIIHPIKYLEPIVARHRKALVEEARLDREGAQAEAERLQSAAELVEDARVTLAVPEALMRRAQRGARMKARIRTHGVSDTPTAEELAEATAEARAVCQRIVDDELAADAEGEG